MNEKSVIFLIDILKNCIGVYFDTFFVFYFFKVANYELIPLTKYYLTLYIFCGVGFFIIRNFMKRNIKIPFFRIGVALQALYISLIMILKDEIINHIYLVGILKGIADGFYHYPKNILNVEKVANEGRQKFDGIVNSINKVVGIIVPLLLGTLLTYYSYTDVGKIFFILFIVIFILTFYLKDVNYRTEKIDKKGFKEILTKNSNVKKSLWLPFCSGLTYSSGVMGLIITLFKINNFKTNLNLGIVDSICAFLSLAVCILFALKLKEKHFKTAIFGCGIVSTIVIVLFGIFPTKFMLIMYLLIRYSLIILIDRISNNLIKNLSNSSELKSEYKAEFYLARDIIYAISRSLGYLILFIVCLIADVGYINYLMIICAGAILAECILVRSIIINTNKNIDKKNNI